MILFFSILLALCLCSRINQYLEDKKANTPIKFLKQYGVSHASEIPPHKYIQPRLKKGQFELILEEPEDLEEHADLKKWYLTMKKQEREKLRTNIYAQKVKVMANRTVQLPA